MPTKAAWIALAENEDDIDFEHFLALKLTMTVSELRARMSHGEFIRWGMYYARISQAKQMQAQRAEG